VTILKSSAYDNKYETEAHTGPLHHGSWKASYTTSRRGSSADLQNRSILVQEWSIDWSISQSVSQSVGRSINQSINQSFNQSTNQSINQSIYQPINQSINQSVVPLEMLLGIK